MTQETRRPRINAGMGRDEWTDYKREHRIVTSWDKRHGVRLPPPLHARSEEQIRAEAAQMLAEQFRAQRKRWGFV